MRKGNEKDHTNQIAPLIAEIANKKAIQKTASNALQFAYLNERTSKKIKPVLACLTLIIKTVCFLALCEFYPI